MSNQKNTQILLLTLFILLSGFYCIFSFGTDTTDKVFITITTFFFSIFTGFFITRQGSRYSKIREIISTYDGKMSGIYRVSGNISTEIQEKVGKVIAGHYKKIIETQLWDYHFTHKSSSITDIHRLLEEHVGSNKQESLRNQSVGRVLANLTDCQVLRKNMVMLHEERIPSFQWFLIIFFTFILLATISVIPSQGFLFGSILKAAFAISIVSVCVILHNLDNLHLFEKFIGKNSAEDVLNIIEGSK